MKKIVALFLTVLMLAATCISVSADPGSFVESPSGNRKPGIVEDDNLDTECTAQLVITHYSERDTLSDEKRLALEDAYAQIVGSEDISTFAAELSSKAASMKINGEDLQVSDLFDISYYGCDKHEDHKGFKIKLESDYLENFVGLLHLHNGKWEFINAERVDERYIVFTVEELSPFAIVVGESQQGGDTSDDNSGDESGDNSGDNDTPQTGDDTNMLWYIAMIVVSATGLVVIGAKSRKTAK